MPNIPSKNPDKKIRTKKVKRTGIRALTYQLVLFFFGILVVAQIAEATWLIMNNLMPK